jgi:hypothetical protein
MAWPYAQGPAQKQALFFGKVAACLTACIVTICLRGAELEQGGLFLKTKS